MKWNTSTLKISDMDSSELDFQKKGSNSTMPARRGKLQMAESKPGQKKTSLDDLTSKYAQE